MARDGFMVTTPIFYISGNPHIGHAYTQVAADVLARYHRTLGPTFFLTGTDEHGQKVAQSAAVAGLAPQAFADSLIERWKALAVAYDIAYDGFIRTTEPRHVAQVIEVFEQLKASGDIYLGSYEGWYCTNDETFWLESKLVDGRCPNPECGRPVSWLSEENWFFALSRYRDRLLAHYRAQPEWLRPERAYNEMLATLEGGLEDLCISRTSVSWGVPIPGGGTIYVWLDALLNYVTALEYAANGERFRTFWPADVQLIGKEIARFHTIVWPAVLWALGLPEPRRVFAHGWILLEGSKISKSQGNVIEPFALVERYGADAIRYFLLREAPFGSDFSFGIEKLEARRNADLANDLGNLVRRTLAMLARYREGIVPARAGASAFERFDELGPRVGAQIAALDFRDALEAIWDYVGALNRFVETEKPWELAKRGEDAALDRALYELCEGLRRLAHLLAPFLPQTAAKIRNELGLAGAPSGPWDRALAWGGLEPGTRTAPAERSLFPRLDEPAPT